MSQNQVGGVQCSKQGSWLGPWLPVLIYMGAIFFLSSQPTLPSPPGVFGKDKFEHILAYFGLGILVFRGSLLWPLLSWPGIYTQTFGIIALYGITDEFHQRFVPGRRCELYDWIADIFGAALAVILIAFIRSYRRNGGKRIERGR
ncbi:MAG: VanZ family protein [Armatimonadetes bacterium]|nr:VanZ family protein [Armatimonadota bacterium]